MTLKDVCKAERYTVANDNGEKDEAEPFEPLMDTEEAKVEEEQGSFCAGYSEEVDDHCYLVPL